MSESEMAQSSFFFRQPGSAAAVERVRTEDDLVSRIRARDEDAFGEMYRKYAPLVHGVVLAKVPYDEVADIVQEVFLAAYRNIDNLRDAGALGGWLVTIARNHAAEYYRRSRPTEELPDELHGRNNPTAEAAEIMRSIKSLPNAYSETLILRLVEGLTGNEIAERTGLKPESVRVNLHRGMDLLRKSLGIGSGR